VKSIFYNRFIIAFTAVVFFVAAYFLSMSDFETRDSVIRKFEKKLHEKEKLLQTKIDLFAFALKDKSAADLFSNYALAHENLFEQDGFIILAFYNDSLAYWSSNFMPISNTYSDLCNDERVVQLKNGWFEILQSSKNMGGFKVVGLILLKNEYAYQNHYLVNNYQPEFDLNKNIQIIYADSNAANTIKTNDGKYLCTFDFTTARGSDKQSLTFIHFLNIIGWLLLIIYLRAECNYIIRKRGALIGIFSFIVFIFSFRLLSIFIHFPHSFYESDLFGPQYYGDASSFWLQSLGDFLINVFLIFYATWYACKNTGAEQLLAIKNKNYKHIILALLFLTLWFVSKKISDVFVGLFQNSSISFNINDVFSLSFYSYCSFFIMGLVLFSYFLVLNKTIMLLAHSLASNSILKTIFVLTIAIHVIICHLLGLRDLILILWAPVLFLMAITFKHKKTNGYVFFGSVTMLSLLTFYAVHVLIKHRDLKDIESRKIYVQKLADEQDPFAEYFFIDIEKKIAADTNLINTIQLSGSEFGKLFTEKYFTGYWEKYDVKVCVFDTMCFPIFIGSNPNRDNHEYYEQSIRDVGLSAESQNYFAIENSSGKLNYIAKIPLYKDREQVQLYGHIYIELESKFVSEEIGFPELLLDREIGLNHLLNGYSYAKYKNERLINRFGKFNYSVSDQSFHSQSADTLIKNFENYNHVIHNTEGNTLVVLSKQNEGWRGFVTGFSYLFTFFSIILLVALSLRQASRGFVFSQMSFKYRIQLLLVLIVLLSLVLFGSGTIYYIKQQYETKNSEHISEKIHSVLIELEGKIGNDFTQTQNFREYTSYLLNKFSNVFFTDINLYDLNGNLFASSRPKIFDEGLISTKMNPIAFLNIAEHKRSEYIHDENIGKLNYISAYLPFYNRDGNLIAYLNLPYFAKQSELEKEISTFLVALINIYVLLFGLSIVVAIFISNYLTKPLKLVREKLSQIKLGKANEPIYWKQHDEIGQLVGEYNRMIAELSKSAEMLGRSERESAWREMAKQVAHEIKNPLTPMKLSIQHMQRLINDKSPDIETKIKKLAKTLIEQIETLSNIATEFSNFAKMPKANNEVVLIHDIIYNSVQLHRNTSDCEIIFTSVISEETKLFADKDQLVRVLNNLIKNATQAIPENRKGLINVALRKTENQILITVKDNGSGISDGVMEKIFVPNFTTKSTGMGLGLAMVKNIIESANGKIWFETKIDEGTTFYVSLPEHNDSN
jgi:signal transduction histidine kinase